jgi:[ribosomal protein S5]-alanine N-acetyltransferase
MAILYTSRLLLRPFRMADAMRVTILLKDYSVVHPTGAIPWPYTLADAQKWIGAQLSSSGHSSLTFAITLIRGQELAGAISLSIKPEHFRGSLGYWVGKNYQGNGYATEAGQAVAELGFCRFGLHKIKATCLVENPASFRVMEKLGMEREGRLRDQIFHRGRFADIYSYGLLKAAWEQKKHTLKSDTAV